MLGIEPDYLPRLTLLKKRQTNRKHCEQGENAGKTQHFLLFPQGFRKPSIMAVKIQKYLMKSTENKIGNLIHVR